MKAERRSRGEKKQKTKRARNENETRRERDREVERQVQSQSQHFDLDLYRLATRCGISRASDLRVARESGGPAVSPPCKVSVDDPAAT